MSLQKLAIAGAAISLTFPLMLGGAGTAAAATGSSQSTEATKGSAGEQRDPKIAAALQRVSDGTWTDADLSLLRSHPKIAERVPDPREDEEVHTEATELPVKGDTSPSLMQAKAKKKPKKKAKRKRVTTYRTRHSITGTIVYRYYTYTEFYYNGKKVTKWGQRYDKFTRVQWGIQIGPQTINTKSGVKRKSATSQMQRRVDYCAFKYGCYNTRYPYIKTTVKGNGKYSTSGKAG
ncbi:hypothetical protein [Streptomyces sp. ODS28]|uniref:hypothetical protein n=1 Tax=Streptomyces sp. ODS28 TaxID=3136688 RepID=UPI0031F061E6